MRLSGRARFVAMLTLSAVLLTVAGALMHPVAGLTVAGLACLVGAFFVVDVDRG